MDFRRLPLRFFRASAIAAVCSLAGWIVVDTLRTVLPLISPLPWYDAWATVDLFGAWMAGKRSTLDVLFAQSNEHRISFPRLVFFADDLFFHGQGLVSVLAIFVVQALHAALFVTWLGRTSTSGHRGGGGRWAIAGVVVALMFSLRQSENFSSGFQLSFVLVFAGATSASLLFEPVAARALTGRSFGGLLFASFMAVLLATFTMANGLVSGFVLVVLALSARLRPSIVLAYAAWAALLALVYLQGYEPVAHHSRPSETLQHPLRVLVYVMTYLGSIGASHTVFIAAGLGFLGMILMSAAAFRIFRQRPVRLSVLPLFGVMIFVATTAAITALGRLDFGDAQALSSRYATGSATFWAAQLCYWWIDPPLWSVQANVPRGSFARGAVAVLGTALMLALCRQQFQAKAPLYEQSFLSNSSENLLLLGLDDPAMILRTAWSDEDVDRLVSVLKDNHISIFGGPDSEAVGRPITEYGVIVRADTCVGQVDSAVVDGGLDPGGVRVAGQGWDQVDRRLIRRIVLADARGNVVGLASGPVPGADARDWQGYAVAPAGAVLEAYGSLADRRLCSLGTRIVTERPSPAALTHPDG